MKLIRMVGVALMAATALMAFAGAASATTVTSPTGTLYTGIIEATSEGTTYLTGPWSQIECEHSHLKGKITTHGKSVTAEGPIETLHFSNCNYGVTVIAPGDLVAHATEAGATLTSKNAIIDVHSSIGRCRFATGTGVDIGNLTDTHTRGGLKATLHIDNSKIPVTEGSFFCGSTGEWEGSYSVINPSTLYID